MQKIAKFEIEIFYDDEETTELLVLEQLRDELVKKGVFRKEKRKIQVAYWNSLPNEQD